MKSINQLIIYGFYGIFLCICLFMEFTTAQIEITTPAPPPPPPLNPLDAKIRINAPMAIIIVTLIGVFFLMGIVSVYVRQCAEGRFGTDSIYVDEDSRRRIARGIDPVIIDTFPTFNYSDVKDLKIGKSVLECAVCLNEFEDHETLRLLPKCCHVFHPECIDTWLISHVTCPVCRVNLVSKPGDFEKFTVLGHYPPNFESQDSRFGHPIRDVNDTIINVIDSPEVLSVSQTPLHNRPPRAPSNNNHRTAVSNKLGSVPLLPRAPSKREKIKGKFPRSHSTGHSLIQPGEDCERFTLRLPEEIRNKLINSGLSRAQSNSLFPREGSMKKGYRSSSVGTGSARFNHGNYERFNEEVRVDRWGFTTMPHFFSRGGSTRSSKDSNGTGDDITAVPKNLLKSVKLPFERFMEKDHTGERSFNKLRSGSPS